MIYVFAHLAVLCPVPSWACHLIPSPSDHLPYVYVLPPRPQTFPAYHSYPQMMMCEGERNDVTSPRPETFR